MKEVIMQVPAYFSDYPKVPICLAELVRCKDCRLNETDDCPMVYYAPLEDGGFETRWWNRPDDFCSWGERSE